LDEDQVLMLSTISMCQPLSESNVF